ncbi:MAG: SPFH domain-containing protein, partial [Lachnospiraceae bacterium]|nr:SPFH domain-containing protein [Lachnospiraceae bacterium]
SEQWRQIRGIEIVSLSFNSVSAPPEDEEMIQELQRKAVYRNAGMAAATLVDAQAEAMKSAAQNQAVGPMFAFSNMNAAADAGGVDLNQLFALDRMEKAQKMPTKDTSVTPDTTTWICGCGKHNTGKFCMECGSPKPTKSEWICSCQTTNTGKFCMECGKPRPTSQE